MKGLDYCKRHNTNYYVNEGCEYCYKEHLKEQELIEKFLEDYKSMRKSTFKDPNIYVMLDDRIKKWEGELKK